MLISNEDMGSNKDTGLIVGNLMSIRGSSIDMVRTGGNSISVNNKGVVTGKSGTSDLGVGGSNGVRVGNGLSSEGILATKTIGRSMRVRKGMLTRGKELKLILGASKSCVGKLVKASTKATNRACVVLSSKTS